jgi:hypothetical protein
MRLLRALCVLACVLRASAQCPAGQYRHCVSSTTWIGYYKTGCSTFGQYSGYNNYAYCTDALNAGACQNCCECRGRCAVPDQCLTCPAGTTSPSGSTSVSACAPCPVGQVIVNSVCTYNDPALKVWWKFEASNPGGNSGSASIASIPIPAVSSVAKFGTQALVGRFDPDVPTSILQPDKTVFSLSFWVFMNATYSREGAFDSNGFLSISSNNGGFRFGVTSHTYGIYFTRVNQNNPIDFDYFWVTQDTWMHIVYTHDRGNIIVYLNGVLKSIVNGESTSWIQERFSFFFGENNNRRTLSYDDVRLYSRILTLEEIKWLNKPCVDEVPFYFDTYTCKCDAGYVGVNAVCTSCGAGKYALTRATVCTGCVAGTYSTLVAASSASACVTCGAGNSTTVVGASSASACGPCPAGTYWIATPAPRCVNKSNKLFCVSCV